MRRAVTVGVAASVLLAGCGPADPPLTIRSPSGTVAAGGGLAGLLTGGRPRGAAPLPSDPASRSRASDPTAVPSPSLGRTTLPRGGRTIIGHSRVVAYYGAAGSGALGVLGAGSPEHAAQQILHRAAGFTPYDRPVQPAMELIATVAQRSPGHDGTFSKPVSAAQIDSYLAVAHAHRMLLVLDLQPGRATFLAQAKALRPFLLDPAVSLALDPEWKVGPHSSPGNGLIGASSAAGINAVGAWLSALVREQKLPDKLLIVHQFTHTMLPDRAKITQHQGIEMVLHADGFGPPAVKTHIFHQLAFPSPPFGVGFKLFLRQDSRLMTPREVMALDPRPDVITYQ